MPYTHTFIDKKFWLHQPNLARSRHRYRGVRESYKINLEMDQTYYDINRLYARKDALVEDREETWDNLHEGWEVPDVEYYWSEAETPSEEPVELMGLAEMASRVEALRNRIKNLEE